MTQFEKIVYFMKKPWVIGLYAILVVFTYIFIDKTVAAYFYQLDLRTDVAALNVLTVFGKWIAYVVLFVASGLYFRYIQVNPLYEGRSWFLLGCILVANLVCLVLKIVFGRARPELLFISNEFGFYWFKLKSDFWSFPSGHTITVVSLAAGLGVLFSRYFYAIFTVALLIASSRILLYYHYVSDVMTGFYVSVLAVGFFIQYLRKNKCFDKKGCVVS
ncbi:MAG: phosphatase PAP2 family protein [Legionella sp.]|uniref:phosphatase PAP2 family protein n=1 Tax=Legionella sp. TaxID=459 RepID=UPI0039E38969